MKKIFFMLVSYISLLQVAFAETRKTAASLQGEITNGLAGNTKTSADGSLANFFNWLKWELFTVTFVIVVGALVYIGIHMVMALGKPDEFKKAWKHFVYVILGIFLVFGSLWIVTLVSGLTNSF